MNYKSKHPHCISREQINFALSLRDTYTFKEIESKTGIMMSDEWLNDTYYLKANGAMAASEWVDSGQYYVNSSGVKETI
mgnify:CR=1 FL=1